MQLSAEHIRLPLFLPATRMDRLEKALSCGADSVILDLEDAVEPSRKVEAREAMRAHPRLKSESDVPIFVRINPPLSRWGVADLDAVKATACAGVMVPKAELGDGLSAALALFGKHRTIALIETARGMASAEEVGRLVARLAFGSLDYALDVGCSPERDALLNARASIVLASRLAGVQAPIDGVTLQLDGDDLLESEARYARSLGFGGKLLIHPKQVAPALRGFAPTSAEIEWARAVVGTCADGGLAVHQGEMVDAPVLARARQILASPGSSSGRAA